MRSVGLVMNSSGNGVVPECDVVPGYLNWAVHHRVDLYFIGGWVWGSDLP